MDLLEDEPFWFFSPHLSDAVLGLVSGVNRRGTIAVPRGATDAAVAQKVEFMLTHQVGVAQPLIGGRTLEASVFTTPDGLCGNQRLDAQFVLDDADASIASRKELRHEPARAF